MDSVGMVYGGRSCSRRRGRWRGVCEGYKLAWWGGVHGLEMEAAVGAHGGLFRNADTCTRTNIHGIYTPTYRLGSNLGRTAGGAELDFDRCVLRRRRGCKLHIMCIVFLMGAFCR